MAAELEQIVLGSCPTCGGPAQFIDAAADRHVVEFDRSGYGLEHPLRCRETGLRRCDFDAYLAAQDEPLRAPGRYVMTFDALRATFAFEPIADGPAPTAVRHVDLRDVPLRRVARELEALRSGAKGLARVAYADALSIVERELEEVKGS